MHWLALLYVCTVSADLQSPSPSTLLRVLDSMAHVMEGPGSLFPRKQFAHISESMAWLDPGLAQSQEQGWRGVITYYVMGGGTGDAWGSNTTPYSEYNATVFPLAGGGSILVYEPCNYASNVAYYHLAVSLASPRHQWSLPTSVTRALAQSAAGLALGSSFMHASNTRLGQIADNMLIGVMSLILHQASLSGIPASLKSSELIDLGPIPRALSGVQIAQVITDMYSYLPVTEWRSTLASLDLPRYEFTFSALVVTLFTLILPDNLADMVFDTLLNLFGIKEEFGTFILQDYVPQIRYAMSGVILPLQTKIQLLLNTVSTLRKLAYAFLWHEDTFKLNTSPAVNRLGVFFQPITNSLDRSISSLPALSPSLLSGRGLYPGSHQYCGSQPHSLWHIQSAAGLLDFFLLMDYVVSLLY